MCRNITTLRGLDPVATDVEIEAAARQYVRKVSGVQTTSPRTEEAVERAVAAITEATKTLLADLPERRQPPPTLPPLRRREAATQAAQAPDHSHAHPHGHTHAHPHDHTHAPTPTKSA
ncbi:hypothetical protein B4N89_13380 [Embleya scabrispora]|uniref:DUF2277 domain-containing protein n=1 Tax=Embleya scabrispora TaxID=159449 RepID=A0A1T3NYF6_9ACTN|nr:DUF2277 domain-containing protein [Embleya scabrispora]OPC81794.1 hypothetical protein B4N89_13380 [Embleya scabrispora]